MKLSDWLAEQDMSATAFGRLLQLQYPRNVCRYLNGRIPTPEIIRKTKELTDGAVTANDWIE